MKEDGGENLHHHDVRDIEDELLKELDALEENYPTSSSASSSPSSSLSSFHFSHEGTATCKTNTPYNDNYHGDCSSILHSLPGFELFKETLEVSSYTCLKTQKVVNSVQETILGEEIILDNDQSRGELSPTEINDISVHKNVEDTATSVEEENGSEEKGRCEGFESTDESFTSSNVKHKQVANIEENDAVSTIHGKRNSDDVLETEIEIQNDTLTLRSLDQNSSKEEVKHHHHHQSTEFLSTILFSDTTTTQNDNSNDNLLQVKNYIEKLQKEAEMEAEKEQHQLRQRHLQKKEKRVLEASKERERCILQTQSARCLQYAFQEFCRKRKSRRLRSFCKGILECSRLGNYWYMKTSFHVLLSFMIETRMVIRIQTHYRALTHRKQKRYEVMIKAMNYVLQRYAMRETLFFWKVLVSTMKLEERLMEKLMSSTLKIQCTYRMYRARLILKDRKRYHMATSIQSTFRGYQARTHYINQREIEVKRRNEASIIIQSLYRGHKTRCRLNMAMSMNYSYLDDDVDEILGQEADLIMNDINLMEGNGPTVEDWIPKKPLHYAVEDRFCHVPQQLSERHHNLKKELQSNHQTKNLKKLNPRSDHDLNSETNVNSNVVTNKNKDNESLMKEWNFNDQRVIEVSFFYF